MANLNTTQIAHNFLGPCERVYHQDLTTHGKQPRLKIDTIEAGDCIFLDTVPAGQNPSHSFEENGLLVSVERPQDTPSNVSLGHQAAVDGQNITMPDRFVLTAASELHQKVIDEQNPSPFTVILHVKRGETDSEGEAMLFVGAEKADAAPFTFGNGLTSATVFDNIRVGIGEFASRMVSHVRGRLMSSAR